MASNRAHHATGWPAGIVAAALVAHAGYSGPYAVWSVLALLAGFAGGTAPDWLEVAWWSRRRRLWITHRTITHWGIAWLALLLWSWNNIGHYPGLSGLFGFACGGLMHLLADWPNPLGVPWILGRHSLNWWKSGKCDVVVVTLAWLAAFFVGDQVWFHGVHKITLLRWLHV